MKRSAGLKQSDPQVARAIQAELKREQQQLILIASENYASRAVLEAQGGRFELTIPEPEKSGKIEFVGASGKGR